MKRRDLIKQLGLAVPGLALSNSAAAKFLSANSNQISDTTFKPTWQSLQGYKVPDWYRNAKFGIWAHWGPQCEPGYGDWYARGMYIEDSDQYKYHLKKYGHPSKFGFKDVINEWKAEKWDPDHLLSLYKKAGAQYFFALANHHDNLDLWNSSHHKWNSVKVGPKKDIIAGWAKAAKKQGLPLGLSVHAAHAWSWYEVAQRSDKNGALKGVPYDGRISKSDGQGKWWQGLDPQELYAQNHPLSQNSLDNGMIHRQWDWGNGVSVPSKEYCNQFLKRTIELIDKYEPELLYFDDTVLPFHELNDVGLQIVAHHYNKSISRNKGSLKAVVNGKILNEMQRKCLVWDIERGQSNQIEPFTWQTDTCLGNWHYDTRVYENKRYKTAKTVIQTLVDVVSKNGNFLLSVPVKGNGEIDELELAIIEEVGSWMKTNSECIFDTRPWKVFGEGPAIENAAPLSAQGFNEGKGKAFTAEDIRFTSKGPVLYAIVYGRPENNKVIINSLGKEKGLLEKSVSKVELLGGGTCTYQINDKNVIIDLPDSFDRESYALVLKIV